MSVGCNPLNLKLCIESYYIWTKFPIVIIFCVFHFLMLIKYNVKMNVFKLSISNFDTQIYLLFHFYLANSLYKWNPRFPIYAEVYIHVYFKKWNERSISNRSLICLKTSNVKNLLGKGYVQVQQHFHSSLWYP